MGLGFRVRGFRGYGLGVYGFRVRRVLGFGFLGVKMVGAGI